MQQPLTHHEILTLIAPFTRRGLRVDMAASRRAERELQFLPVEQAPVRAGGPRLRDQLTLTVSERGRHRLVRSVTPLDAAGEGPAATVSAAGADLEVLLRELLAFEPARLFPACEGARAQRSYRLEPSTTRDTDTQRRVARLVSATAEIQGVRLAFDAELGRSPVKVRLSAPAGRHLQVPADLFAVLGRHWRSLDDYADHWRSSVRVAKREPRRTRDIEARFERTVAHLVATLAQSPAQFHARHRGRRWLAAAQRGVPLLVVLLMVGVSLALANVELSEGNVLRMLVFHLPPILLLLFFLMFDELPPFAIPRIPRALQQDDWLARPAR